MDDDDVEPSMGYIAWDGVRLDSGLNELRDLSKLKRVNMG